MANIAGQLEIAVMMAVATELGKLSEFRWFSRCRRFWCFKSDTKRQFARSVGVVRVGRIPNHVDKILSNPIIFINLACDSAAPARPARYGIRVAPKQVCSGTIRFLKEKA